MPIDLTLPADYERLIAMMSEVTVERPVFLLDGGSGAGKTQLSETLLPRLQQRFDGIQLLSIENFYQGWDGLAEAADYLVDGILASPSPGYLAWDWHRGRPDRWVELDPAAPLLIEGCGTITTRSVEYSDLGIWLERPEEQRKQLALARDGDTFAPWWDAWAESERKLRAKHPPLELADVKVTFCDSLG